MCTDIRDKLSILLSIIRTPGIGSVTFNNLLDQFGSLEDIAGTSLSEIKDFLGDNRHSKFNGFKKINKDVIDNQIERMKKSNASLLLRYDEGYPSSLLHINTPPPFIFVRGKLENRDEVSIGVVGCRQKTNYGEQTVNKIVHKLASSGVTIVSGFAYGIDTSAHKAAIKAKGRTIAVLGCGVDICYPPSNSKLYENFTDHGAMISEFPMGTEPAAHNFPIRNRIISGLSLGVLVVEAAIKSGSLITANYAKEQNKQIFSIPGSILEKSSTGTNQLIKNGASLVTDAEDIMKELGIEWIEGKNEKSSMELPLNLPDKQLQILNNLTTIPISIDNLSKKIGMNAAELLAQLSFMELNGHVLQRPGKQFIRKV